MKAPNTFVTLAAAAVLGAAGGATVVAVAGDSGGTTTVTAPAPASARQIATAPADGQLTAAEIYARARDSVVYITAERRSQPTPFGAPTGREGEATGSGFVIDDDGRIVTNAHVIEGADRVSVKIGDGAPQQAEVVGSDASTDIALLKVRDGSGLTPLPLGDSDALTVGDPTFAIGNPFGLDRTLTTGVVSALQRQITAPNGFSIDGVIQTDAPINPGNSGGPLIDGHGKVIGVNSQILTGSSTSEGNVGIGFAVPVNTVKNVIEQLERTGQVEHAFLGVQMGDAEGGGARVGGVTRGGPAAAAGIEPGDLITGFDGKAVDDAASLAGMVNARKVGEKVSIELRRDGASKTVEVTLGKQPASARGQTP